MSATDSALIIGVGKYPPGIKSLPAVAADVREVGNLLGSENGEFKNGTIAVLTDEQASRAAVLQALEATLLRANGGGTTFVYMAGHGTLKDGQYYFLPQDSKKTGIEATAIPLPAIKALFDKSPSNRLFLWLDFCHSGGILARSFDAPDEGSAEASLARTLNVVSGEGRIIMCACTSEQSAYEGPLHGHYTQHLLAGLRGAALNANGEVTLASLHEYIDTQLASDQQTPMLYGTMRGRIVLMHSRSVASTPPPSVPATGPVTPGSGLVVVKDTGKLVMLEGRFYPADRVHQEANGLVIFEVATEEPQQEANIRGLQGDRFNRSKNVAFAHRNDGGIAKIKEISSEYRGDKLVWIISLQPEPAETYSSVMSEVATRVGSKNYTPDAIAELRARRLLLGETLPRDSQNGGSMLEILVQGMSGPMKATVAVLSSLQPRPTGDPTAYLNHARLSMVYALKASGVFEHILELNVGPLVDNKVRVRCRGRRRQIITNRPAPEFEIEGNCPL